jgi:hypothetical protein
MIFQPEDLLSGKASFLCATQVQFLLRQGKLDMITTMRSNDVWHGLPYNLFQFGMLQCTLANTLGVKPGRYTHNAGSMHLYKRHWEKARLLTGWETEVPKIRGLGRANHTHGWSEVQKMAHDLLEGKAPFKPTDDELWLRNTLHGPGRSGAGARSSRFASPGGRLHDVQCDSRHARSSIASNNCPRSGTPAGGFFVRKRGRSSGLLRPSVAFPVSFWIRKGDNGRVSSNSLKESSCSIQPSWSSQHSRLRALLTHASKGRRLRPPACPLEYRTITGDETRYDEAR